MKFLEEIVVDEFLPTVRSMLAEELLHRDLTQQEVASILELSQSAVSKYAHQEVDRHPVIESDPRVEDTVEELAAGLADGTADTVGALIELEVLIRELEAPGDVLSRLHESAVPALAEYDDPFSIHDPDSTARTRAHVRSSVRQAVRRFAATPGSVQLLPEVGANIVEITPTGTSHADVAAVPGRLIEVNGQVQIPAEPDYGVSGHLASVLLAVRDAGNPATAAMTIRYDAALVEQFPEGRTLEIPGDGDIVSTLQDREHIDESVRVIAQTGGFGIEPIIYLFAEDAPAVVDMALSVLE